MTDHGIRNLVTAGATKPIKKCSFFAFIRNLLKIKQITIQRKPPFLAADTINAYLGTKLKKGKRIFFPVRKPCKAVCSYRNDYNFFPQADDFDPHLFDSTHKSINTVSKTGILYIELLFKTLNQTLNYISDTSGRNLFIWGKNMEYAQQFGSFDRIIFFEHGWLPRSSYQMSPDGINFAAHFARWKYDPNHKIDIDIAKTVINLRHLLLRYQPNEFKPMPLEKDFIIFPFQKCNDFNLKYAGEPFSAFFSRDLNQQSRYTQFCIDYISEHNPQLPVIFKQHITDQTDQKNLQMRRKQDILLTNNVGLSLSDLLNSKQCKGLITVNSNSLHEALVFNVPVKALGNFIATQAEYSRILGPLDAPLVDNPLNNEKILEYLKYVISHQGYLSDFANPLIVREILANNGYVCMHDIRRKYFIISN